MPNSRTIDITEGFLKTESIDTTYGDSSILTIDGNVTVGGDWLQIPSGTTAERPGTTTSGMIRYNTTTSKLEINNDGSWNNIIDGTVTNDVLTNSSITIQGDSGSESVSLGGTINFTGRSNETSVATTPGGEYTDATNFSYLVSSASFPVLSDTESKTGSTSAYFGSTNEEIKIPQEQDVIQSALSANNQFTIEFWYYIETATFAPRLVSVQSADGDSNRQIHIAEYQGSLLINNHQGTKINAGSVSDQTWHHLAVTFDNGTLKLYVDGVLEGTSTGVTFINAPSSATFNIGGTGPFAASDSRFHLDGYIDLFRVSNNVRYTTTFTPPTTAFTPDANTTILFNFDGTSGSQDFKLLDNTSVFSTATTVTIDLPDDVTIGNDLTVTNDLTVSGNLTVQGTTTTVDSTTINIQNAFVFEGATADDFETTLTVTDPTADRTITLPDATGTVVLQDSTDTLTNKTINSASNTITITESNISDLGAYITASSTDTLTNKTLSATTIAGHLIPDTDVTYDLGSSTYKFRDLYLSGSSIQLGDATITASGSSLVLPAGTSIPGDMTITNDISVNTSTSAVPVYSTSFLPNNADVDTKLTDEVVKFGTTSLRVGERRAAGHEGFTTRDFLDVNDNGDITGYMADDANNDFTIELWFYDNTLLGSDPEASSAGNIIRVRGQLTVYHSHDYSSPPTVGFGAGNGTTTTTTGTASDEWHHIAIVNQSGVKTFYLDGALVGSQTSDWTEPTDPNGFAQDISYIRFGNSDNTRRRFNGFIDGFRISSTARYTSSFTPPTEAFTKDGDTLLLMNFEGDVDSQTQFLVESINDTTTDAGVFVDGSASRLGVNNVTPTEAIDVVGTVKATTFSGSGSSLTSIPNSALDNSSITIAGDSGSDSVALGETLTISGTANEIETTGTSNTLTIGLPDDVTIGNDLTVTEKLKINTTTQLGRLTISGSNDYDDGPVLWLHGDAANQQNSGTIRLTENNASMQGAWISYNGSGNRLLLGTNAGSTFDTSNDVTHISMLRGSGFVGINIGDANPAYPLVVGNNEGILDAAIEIKGLFPYLRYTDTGDSTYVSQQLNSTNFTHTQSGNIQYQIIQDTSTRFYYNAIVDGDLTVDTDTLYVDSTNNRVGIGTTSPSYRLHVDGNDSTNPQLWLKQNNNGTGILRLTRQDATDGQNGDWQLVHSSQGLYLQHSPQANSISSPSWVDSLRIQGANNNYRLLPGQDNVQDLGQSDRRWQDLFMAGNIYLGGTGSANALDDYEEGTWTPSVTGGVSVTSANYVKIGRFVHVNFEIVATSNNSGDFSGLPFTWSGRSAGIVGYQNDNSSTWSIVTEGGTGFSFRAGSTQQHLEAGELARCSLMYMTA